MYANDTTRALHAAVLDGNLQAVKKMLAKGADVDAADYFQVRPVHIAAEHGRLDILNVLIARGCDVNARAFGSVILSKEIDQGATQFYSQISNDDPRMVFPASLMIGAGLSFASFIGTQAGLAMSPLHYAARFGHLSAVKALVSAKADVNAADNVMKFTPLSIAVRGNFEDIAKFLVQSGAVVNSRESDRSTPLHIAAEIGNLDITTLLVRNKAAVNVKNQEGLTPLHVAIQNRQAAISQFLINRGADVNAKDKEGSTPLLTAAQSGPAEVVRHLIEKGVKVNVRDRSGRTPLHLAAHDCTDVANVLVENKADVNVTDDRKWTPLHYAAYAGNLDTVKVLIAKGANIAAVAEKQATPLHLAADCWHVEVVKHLLVQGATVNSIGHMNWTPLHYAADNGSSKGPLEEDAHSNSQSRDSKVNTVKALIENEADVNAKGRNEETALHLAVKCGDHIVARYLLENGAYYDVKPPSYFGNDAFSVNGGNLNGLLRATEKLFQAVKRAKCAEIEKCIREGAPVNSRSIKYETPLMYASWKGHLAVVNVLLVNGADANLGNSNGVTPLHYAAKFGHHEILCALLRHGAVYNAETKTGKKTPLHFAQQEGNIEVADSLQLIESLFDRVSKPDVTLQKLKHIKYAEFLAIKNCK